jgi:hypothetical protein
MKYSCEIIKDLLPLYKDGIASKESELVISEHLASCEDCKKYYDDMQKNELVEPDVMIDETVSVLNYATKIKKRRFVIAASVVFIFLALLASFISYVQFEVANPISSGVGVIRIFATDVEYVEIQKSPRVVIGKPDNAWEVFLKTMEKDGYSYLEDERLASMCVFEKDGVRENVFFHVNRYYSKWVWSR